MERDIHYKVGHLSLKEKKELCKKAFELKSNWWVDILDCNKSIRRHKIKMSFDEILTHLTSKACVTFIHRAYLSHIAPERLEIGFRSMEYIDYFLWIYVAEKYKDEFKKYQIEYP